VAHLTIHTVATNQDSSSPIHSASDLPQSKKQLHSMSITLCILEVCPQDQYEVTAIRKYNGIKIIDSVFK